MNGRGDEHSVEIAQARKCKESLARLLEGQRPFVKQFASQKIDPRIARRAEAGDVVQVVLFEATKGFSDFRGETLPSLRAWLKTITSNTLADLVRKHVISEKRSVNSETNVDDSSVRRQIEPTIATPTPRTRLIASEKAVKLEKLLEKLPESQCEAIRLRYFGEGQHVKDVAKQLGKSIQATAGLLKRGLAKLRELAGDDDILS